MSCTECPDQLTEPGVTVLHVWCQRKSTGKEKPEYSNGGWCVWAHGASCWSGCSVCILFQSHLSDKARWIVDPEYGPLLLAIENLWCLGDPTPHTPRALSSPDPNMHIVQVWKDTIIHPHTCQHPPLTSIHPRLCLHLCGRATDTAPPRSS